MLSSSLSYFCPHPQMTFMTSPFHLDTPCNSPWHIWYFLSELMRTKSKINCTQLVSEWLSDDFVSSLQIRYEWNGWSNMNINSQSIEFNNLLGIGLDVYVEFSILLSFEAKKWFCQRMKLDLIWFNFTWFNLIWIEFI